MAQVYGHPKDKGFTLPVMDYTVRDIDAALAEHEKKMRVFKDALAKYCKEQSNCPHAGEIISFQVADGFAEYMVFSYGQIVFIPDNDQYSVDEVFLLGIGEKEIVKMIELDKLMDSYATPQIQR